LINLLLKFDYKIKQYLYARVFFTVLRQNTNFTLN
jgi:hypothetical protein